MKQIIALSVESNCVRAVALSRNRWRSALFPVEDHHDLATSVASVLQQVTEPGYRSEVRVVIGPAHCQTRSCDDLPARRGKELKSLVHHNAAMLFPGGSARTLAASIHGGAKWAESYDTELVGAVCTACQSTGAQVTMVVSAATTLAAYVGSGPFEWLDGRISLTGEARKGALIALHRGLATAPLASEPVAPDDDSTALGDAPGSDSPYRLAIGAMRLRRNSPLRLRPDQVLTASPLPSWRLNLAAACLAGTVVVGAGAVIGSAAYRLELDTRKLESIQVQVANAEQQQRALRQVESKLEVLDGMTAARIDWNALLAQLAEALPPNAALSAFGADSSGGRIVVIADRAMEALAALEEVRAIHAPRIDGPVSRDRLGDRSVERATVRFGIQPGTQ